jgi:ABC-2 type transport system permease protein
MKRDGRLAVLTILLAVLSLVSLVAGFWRYKALEAEMSRAQTAERRVWTAQAPDNPHGASHFGVWAFRLPSAWLAFEPGVSQFVGSGVFLESHRENPALFSSAIDDPPPLRLSILSPGWVLLTIVPLLVSLLAAHSWSSEKDSGRLRLLLSLGVSPRALCLGKIFALWGACVVLLSPVLLVAYLILGGELIRFGALMVGLLASLGIAVLLGTGISLRAKNGSQAAFRTFALWLGFTFLLPSALAELTRVWYTSPNRSAIEQSRRDILKESEAAHKSHLDELQKRYSGPALDGRKFAANEQRDTEVTRAASRPTERQIELRRRALDSGGFLSPYLAARQLNMALAQSSSQAQEHFVEQAQDFRYDFVQQLNEALSSGEEEWKAGDWDRVRPFVFQPQPVEQIVREALTPLCALGLWLLLGFWFVLSARFKL